MVKLDTIRNSKENFIFQVQRTGVTGCPVPGEQHQVQEQPGVTSHAVPVTVTQVIYAVYLYQVQVD